MSISRRDMIAILAEADPMDLVRRGAPADEYAREADEILSLTPPIQLTEITSIFSVSFDEPGACSREKARWIVEEMQRRVQPG